MERKIGDKFNYRGCDYIVEEAEHVSPCRLCAFGVCEEAGENIWVTCSAPFITGECGLATRSDGKDVYFRRVE